MLSRKDVCSALLLMANIILIVMTIIPKGSVAAIDADETFLINQEYRHNEVGSSMENFLYKNQLIEEQIVSTDKVSDEVIWGINNQFEGKEEAYAYVIGGEVIAYLSSKKEAEEVTKNIMLQYMSEEEFYGPKGFLEKGKIMNVQLSEPITYEYNSVHPDQLHSVEETLTFIKEGKLILTDYMVENEKNLQEIADTNHLTIEEMLQLNSHLSTDDVLKKGDVVVISKIIPYIQVAVERELPQKFDIPFETKVKENETLFTSRTQLEQDGRIGSEVEYQEIKSGNITKNAVNEQINKRTNEVPSQGTGSFIWPADGGYISSEQGRRWGKMHKGVDIAQSTTRTIYAADQGTVVEAGISGGYGNKIRIDHNNGYETIYAHLESIDVKIGDIVYGGSEIGIMGSTGQSNGEHLHFEIWKNGRLVNPLEFISH
ncbi:peptidoglycan DD-metalloendopeptidase family protein [Peribacillus huizhouensis]|uniref:Murein DD-endopeptidase MepM/ murein hydrolase activator NlpD n=1 Tax=Peribacillus huizhouensis TaxID=1501239 RepID=A0ABR6CSS1_9BACI|nr:M23 family metallopeptidase [Peribacillus huizhouensis]MBA9028058.1 murein DD-endopeptidase MepM/ murein hydrolase activator NlpD [Peribacillus huizhouensis]